MSALGSLLAANDKREFWRIYMAELVWCQAKAYYKEFPLKSYYELVSKPEPEDTRTGQEIVSDLIAQLRR